MLQSVLPKPGRYRARQAGSGIVDTKTSNHIKKKVAVNLKSILLYLVNLEEICLFFLLAVYQIKHWKLEILHFCPTFYKIRGRFRRERVLLLHLL